MPQSKKFRLSKRSDLTANSSIRDLIVNEVLDYFIANTDSINSYTPYGVTENCIKQRISIHQTSKQLREILMSMQDSGLITSAIKNSHKLWKITDGGRLWREGHFLLFDVSTERSWKLSLWMLNMLIQRYRVSQGRRVLSASQ